MATKAIKAVGETSQTMPDYEAWRQALEAFYRVEACAQSAENVRRGDPLTNSDRRLIDALIVAGERAPSVKAA